MGLKKNWRSSYLTVKPMYDSQKIKNKNVRNNFLVFTFKIVRLRILNPLALFLFLTLKEGTFSQHRKYQCYKKRIH